MAIPRPDPPAAPVCIHLFGRFEACLDGAPLPRLRSRKVRSLLALLTLRAGAGFDRTWLAGLLWPGSPERTALATLRRDLTDLRRALGPAADRLRSPTPRTLCLHLHELEADVVAFDLGVARGDPESLAAAAALYRGPLLEGWTEEWVFQERSCREQRYLQVLETLAAGALASGEIAAAERHLLQAVAVDPLRESAQRALMQTFAAGGNYAAALFVYRELRLRLHRELNVEPDAETQALFERLRQEARGKSGEIRRSSLGAPRALEERPNNLPFPLSSLIGRQREVGTARELLQRESVRLMTFTGPGGSGKTRLALQVAEEALDDFSGEVFFVDLAPLRGPELVAATIAQTLGLRESGDQPVRESLKASLRLRQLLLLLDNFEHLLGAAPLVVELLQAAPGLKVLITSREALHVSGEQEFSVPPLAVPGAECRPVLERLAKYGAVELFVQRAANVRPSFCLTEANAVAVVEICRRLDGLPLALELAASRVKLLSVEQIAARLADTMRLLSGGSRTALPRHETLHAAIDWSYTLLTEQERRVLRSLSVFAGGWTLDAAESVCANECVAADEIFDRLAQLVEKSMVVVEEGAGGETRYRLLETIRQYSRVRLVEAREADAVCARHKDWFLKLAEQAEPELWRAEQAAWLDRLEAEHDNLRTALEWCQADPGGTEDGVRLAGSLWRFWSVRGYLAEGRSRLTVALSRPASGAPSVLYSVARAKALDGAGLLAMHEHEFHTARVLCEESLAIGRELGDKRVIATALNSQGDVMRWLGDPKAARACYEEGLAVAREVEEGSSIAYALTALGILAAGQGDCPAARSLFEEGLAIKRQLKDKRSIAYSLGSMVRIALQQGDYLEARSLGLQSLTIWRELRDQRGMAYALSGLGQVAHAAGDYVAARRLHEECLALRRTLGNPREIRWALSDLAEVARKQGDCAAERRFLQEILPFWQAMGDRNAIAQCMERLACLPSTPSDDSGA